MEGRRAALALARVRIVRRVRQFREATRQHVVLEVRAWRLVAIGESLLIDRVKVLRDVKHLRVVAADQVAAGGGRHLAESNQVHVGELDVFVALEAQRLHRNSPAAHHKRMPALVGGVRGDDEEEAVQGQKFMRFLAAEPALIG